jgi:AcrR family transcriptional regulator
MATRERPLRKDAERNRQRILDAARELFAERGLGVTLNDIAHHAGVGVGTVYRRFPDKAQLVDGLFEQRLRELLALADAARAEADPWRALSGFLEQALELQAADRGLKDLLLGAPGALERVAAIRAELLPRVAELVERAQTAGALRTDVAAEDLGVVQLMAGAVIDAGHGVAPELWRRYLALMLRGLRAEPTAPDPLPEPSVSPDELDALLVGGWKQRRG